MVKKKNGSASLIQEVVQVTPDLAKRWLMLNQSDQRPLSPTTVTLYARDMLEGRWRLTHQGIAFGLNGTLADGQHRLHAIVQAGVSIKMVVARGFDVEYDSPIDQGRGRSLSAITHRSSRCITMHRGLFHCAKGTIEGFNRKVSLGEITECMKTFEVPATMILTTIGTKLNGGVLTALAWCLPIDEEKILNFGLQVKSGEMLERGDPAYALRMWIENHRRANGNELVFVTCSAARAAIEGTRLTYVVAGPTGYRWSCQRRRALHIQPTPSPDVVSMHESRHDRKTKRIRRHDDSEEAPRGGRGGVR